jgi:GH25 family lysozyme M1 (1,4-beta-N-acetylmuramidase)
MRSLRRALLPLLALALPACADPSSFEEPLGTAASALVVCPGPSTRPGIDVSEYQGDIDWNAVKASGIAFAIARVDDGFYLDKKFEANWPAMKAAGIIRGAYQFFEPGDDPSALADIMIQKMGPLGVGDLPPTLDVETTDGQSPATIAAHIHTWVDKVQAATGRTPLIYTGKYFWNDNVGSADFAGLPLWLAAYVQPCPSTPDAWGGWAMWQYNDNGSIPGIGPLVDVDMFNGTQAELEALASPPNAAPIGWIDGADCAAGITGWAQDPSAPDAPIAVHLYFDGPAGDPAAIGIPLTAGNHRDDLCAAIGSCNHGFAFPIPASLQDGKAHPVHAYGIDTAGGNNPELSGSPLTFTCAPPALPATGVRRWITSPDVLSAWHLGFIDVSHRSDEEVNAFPDGAQLPAAPEVVLADDGTPEVWVIDTGYRRHVIDPVSLAAWHFDGPGGIVSMPAAQVYAFPKGPDFRPAPRLIQGSMPQVYLLDDPLESGSGSGGGSGVGGGSGSGVGGGSDTGSGGVGEGGSGTGNGASSMQKGACAISAGSGASLGWDQALFGLALAALFRRRARQSASTRPRA